MQKTITARGNTFKTLILTLLFVVGCGKFGKPDVNDQPGGELDLPEHETSSSPLNLVGGTDSVSFSGSAVFWNEEASPDQIQAIAKGSSDLRVAQNELLKFAQQDYVPFAAARQAAEQKVVDLEQERDQIKAANKKNDNTLLNAARTAGNQWFESVLAEMVEDNAISTGDADFARDMFAAYCEAKIWDLATSVLATIDYTTRPTPNQMCEPYYASEENQYFVSADGSCEDEPNGKSYFACIWQHGVLKSKLWLNEMSEGACNSRPRPDDYANRQAAIDAWLAGSPSLLEMVVSGIGTRAGTTTMYTDLFKDLVRTGDKIGTSLYLRRNDDGERLYEDMKRCREAFVRDFTVPASGVEWQYSPIFELLLIGDASTSPDALSGRYAMLPRTGNEADDIASWEKLARYVGKFTLRSEQMETLPLSYSVNDALFSRPTKHRIESKPHMIEQLTTDPLLRRLIELEDFLVPEEIKLKIADAKDELAAFPAQEAEISESTGELVDGIRAALFQSAEASRSEGAAVGVAQFQIQMSQKACGLLVQFSFDGSESRYEGCIADDGFPEPMVMSDQVESFEFLRFDAANNRLVIEVPVSKKSGIWTKPRGEDSSFLEVKGDDLFGTTVLLEVYPSMLEDNLRFITGNVDLIDYKGDAFVKGSLSGSAFGSQLNATGMRL